MIAVIFQRVRCCFVPLLIVASFLTGLVHFNEVLAQTETGASSSRSFASTTFEDASVSVSESVVNEESLHGHAAAALVMKSGSKKVVYAYRADTPYPAASLTKLANALAFARVRVPLNKRVALAAQDEVGGGRLRVRAGARMTVRDLLYASITASANNTANALARVTGVSRTRYLKLMNEEARKAGAKQSVFVDASGIDPDNLTTARDVALIAERAFSYPEVRRAASTASYQFAVQDGKKIIKKIIKNTNDLLTKDEEVWVTGGKTGYLEEAHYNLVVRLRPLDEFGQAIRSQELTVVVLGAPTKAESFATAKALAQRTWKHEF